MPLIEIKSCAECRHMHTTPDYTEDSFERPEKWLCKEAGDKVITRYQEWNDPKPDVPSWCPLAPGAKPAERVWMVTASFKTLVVAKDMSEAEDVFWRHFDNDCELDVEGPVEEYSHIDADITNSPDDPPWGTDKPLTHFLGDVEED